MAPAALGASRLHKYSFARTMLRRASLAGWKVSERVLDLDAQGRGEVVYEVSAGSATFHFVAFTTTIDEAAHTDRVVANSWEITGCLFEGDLDTKAMALLRTEVPAQEDARLDPRVLTLFRGNRSVRFFQYLVDQLASGRQPESDDVADAGYIMRSTAFYANGKFGMRSFASYPPDHELSVPYRAQLLSAWLFRELSYDVVEHCARAKGQDNATGFDHSWRRFFGLGNATGLGLVPYAFNHPRILHAWAAIREIALADVRSMTATPSRLERLQALIKKAEEHYRSGTTQSCDPFLSPAQLVPVVGRIGDAFESTKSVPRPFDSLYRWAESEPAETTELVVSLLVELHEGDDRLIDELLRVDESVVVDPAMTVGQALGLLVERFGWLDSPGVKASVAHHEANDWYWWAVSDNTDEPRRALRSNVDPQGRDTPIDIARRMVRLREALGSLPNDEPVCELAAEMPQHRLALERLVMSDGQYCEPHDDACSVGFVPLQIQRFQLAMYGMDNFKPKSTDWLRVTLFQGAPRIADLDAGLSDDWAFPPRPRSKP